jgi:glucose-6-phosphate 1-dehydrogenase
MGTDSIPQPTILVIFGAGGDLSWRKLVPGLFGLFADKWQPERLAVIGVDRKEMNDDEFRQHMRDGVEKFSGRGKPSEQAWKDFASHLVKYISADFGESKTYRGLSEQIQDLEKSWNTKASHLFYLAIPPQLVETIITQLAKAGLAKDRDRARVIVEKPFGRDVESARALNHLLTSIFYESQIFRIDHYLGKETVQNILAFRFGNPLYEPIWDRRYIDHVTITVAEEVGVEHRGAYYDRAGALRDMVQNHLLQIFCLVAMEPPVSFHADEIRNKTADVLHAIRPFTHDSAHAHAVRGQYGSGWLRGNRVTEYRKEPDVASDSRTETFAALKLYVDNWRWQDVPFYLRTGKRLAMHASEVSIRFRAVPHQSFPEEAAEDWHSARLVICIQPYEGIVIKFQAKKPGPKMRLLPVAMHFSYAETFTTPTPSAYETLLWDVMMKDATLFMRADQVEAAWSLLMPILEVWENEEPSDFPNYNAGSWGPEAAESLIARDGRGWLQPTILNVPEKSES